MESLETRQLHKICARDMRESLRRIEDSTRPATFGNLKVRARLQDGWAMLHGVDPLDFEFEELD